MKRRQPSRTETLAFLSQLASQDLRTDRTAEMRAANEAYKIGQRSKVSRNWEPKNVAGDTATADSINLGGARAREQVRNNPQLKGVTSTLTDLIVGQGVRAFAAPFSMSLDELFDDPTVAEPTGAMREEMEYALESDTLFDRWADNADECDTEGASSFWEMQRLGFSEMIETGDSLFYQRQNTQRDRLVPYSLQHIEREQLDTTKDKPASAQSRKIVNGIEVDKNNRPVTYHIFDAHPDDDRYSGGIGNSTPIPAEKMLHNFIKFRPSMTVGFTWFHAIAGASRDRHWLVGSELTKAAIGALLTLVHYRNNPDQTPLGLVDGEGDVDEHGNELVKMATGGITMQAGLEDKVELFQSSVQGAALDRFVEILDHDSARGVGLSHLRYSGRWKGLSYVAGRGAQLDDEMHARPLKNFWGRKLALPVRRAVNAQLIASGKMKSISHADFADDPHRWQTYFTVGPGREMLDPENETSAALALLRAGMSTLQIECGKRGLHWLHVLRQMRREMITAKLFGLALDFSKGQGGQSNRTTTDGSDDESEQSNKERGAA